MSTFTKRVAVPLLASLGLGASGADLAAQTHARSRLIRGQNVELTVTGAPPQSLAPFLLGLGGLGQGRCLLPPFDAVCLDILDPWFVIATAVPDANGRAAASFVLPASTPLIRIQSQALILDPVTVRITKSNAIDGAVETLGALDDEFDGGVLSSDWQLHNAHMLSHSVVNDELRLRPTASGARAIWFNDDEGPSVYKLVRGDFSVSARVKAVDGSDPTRPPDPICRVGGLVIRDPASQPGSRSWLYLVLGGGIDSIPLLIEDKSTIASNSVTFFGWPLSQAEGDVRIDRRGTLVTVFYRPHPAVAWIQLRSHDRPDLPPTLQVGPCLYAMSSPPDVEIRYQWVRFSN